jgi:hypothetical protein
MQGVRDLLLISANCQKPSQGELDTLVAPLSKGIDAMNSAKNGDRKERDWFTHLTFIATAAPLVGWVLSVSLCRARLPHYHTLTAYTDTICRGCERTCRLLREQNNQRVEREVSVNLSSNVEHIYLS